MGAEPFVHGKIIRQASRKMQTASSQASGRTQTAIGKSLPGKHQAERAKIDFDPRPLAASLKVSASPQTLMIPQVISRDRAQSVRKYQLFGKC